MFNLELILNKFSYTQPFGGGVWSRFLPELRSYYTSSKLQRVRWRSEIFLTVCVCGDTVVHFCLGVGGRWGRQVWTLDFLRYLHDHEGAQDTQPEHTRRVCGLRYVQKTLGRVPVRGQASLVHHLRSAWRMLR